jgi:hypothetical protein
LWAAPDAEQVSKQSKDGVNLIGDAGTNMQARVAANADGAAAAKRTDEK